MNAAPQTAILTVNAGSSSLKFALYPHRDLDIGPARLSGNIEGLEPGGAPTIKMSGPDGTVTEAIEAGGDAVFEQALLALEKVLARHTGGVRISAIAHRIVHGGERLSESVLLDGETITYLNSLIPLAPLHQPHNMAGVHAFRRIFPNLPQVGCFDTAFHATLPMHEQLFALPRELRKAGIRRYGFHGLSYRYVTDRLLERSPRAGGKTIVAHLGNGASATAIANGKSVATTMGFTALDGLVMGTRCGAIDPGILLHLLRRGWTAQQLERTLYRESGLRGVSGVSADMRTLHASDDPNAALAIQLFIHRLVRECGSLTASMGGLDAIAFTGGIGEHDTDVRQRVCEGLAFLGVRIDAQANRDANGDAIAAIQSSDSAVEVWVVPTDEGRVAAQDAARLIAQDAERLIA